jgi:hypothetical protein
VKVIVVKGGTFTYAINEIAFLVVAGLSIAILVLFLTLLMQFGPDR